MKKIYCFGNEFLEDDKLAKQLADQLTIEGYEFIKVDDFFQIIGKDKNLIIMDVVQGIKEPTKITDTNQLKSGKKISLHDFDLTEMLKLLKKVNNVSFTIIGIPQKGNIEKIKSKIKEML